jgi:SLT domain-containing protein
MMIASILFLLSIVTVYGWDGENKESVKEYVVYVAQNEGVHVGMALGIVKGESGFNKDAKNPVGTASGLFQFLDSTFRNYCINKYHMALDMKDKNNPFIQTNCAIEMLKEPSGYMHWWESRASWRHYLNA